MTLSHHQAWGTQGENPRTCLATVTSAGTYRVANGTGRYRHVSGHGTYSLTAYAIVRKTNGKCGTKVVPYAQTELLTADGPLTGWHGLSLVICSRTRHGPSSELIGSQPRTGARAYIGDMSESPPDEASGETAAAKLDAEAEAEARIDAESEAAAELEPEAEGEE